MEARFEALLQRLEKDIEKLERNQGAGDEVEIEKSPFDDYLEAVFPPLLEVAHKLPEPVPKMTEMLEKVFREEQILIRKSLKCKKPTPEQMKAQYKPVADAINAIGNTVPFKTEPNFGQWKVVEELSKCANWVEIEKTPMDYVDNTWQVADFYNLKIIRENRGTNQDQVTWAQGIKKVATDLLDFIKEHYRTGLSWKRDGIDIDQYTDGSASSSSTPSSSSSIPAPPAIPAAPAVPAAPPVSASSATAAEKPAADTTKLFAELCQGEGITSRLRHVSDSEKTKNRPREERKFTVPSSVGEKRVEKEEAVAGPKAKAVAPPVFQNFGNKLKCENQVNVPDLTLDSDTIQQTVYMYNCKKSALRVTGKVNSIVIDKCVGCTVVVDDVVSTVELINSKDTKVQVLHVCASFLVESSEGAQIYVSADCMEKVEVFSSKSANIIIYAPGIRIDPDTKEKEEGMIEHALPSTLRTVFKDGELAHDFVKHG
ncbi:Adenylyl cyclase-associated protein CAP [Monocercomonoides exilis]|uniref:Adenylyl cyclase-associated protein CAP n=1 Tax=Monocercomonoides exilis TaxID=2049356 RepID=UPI003559D0E7|nr:Adenylyl cyclase-associated protein CAP [Monocercomonoides exilis]|eukprot:MONOS_12283.1-p1 / transcript=MONOS_12283.1 / gene=MONOS_12283 / organism=Monocercomonoides_exilis_PA203 / gene_product=Adenylyl cyclase-associated protein CAP / transcript_product=Adenylyl cyclase-associated protein CAP / location=Mono_scaffold00670:19959-22264(-) / protein_length=483 / sequence_SO=supercontig / SO=protein_coding / is_pseudo=false